MKRIALIMTVVAIWLMVTGAISTVGLILSIQSNHGVHSLSVKTAKEVSNLEQVVQHQDQILQNVVYLVNFVKNSQKNGGKATAKAIHAIVTNLDKMIHNDIGEYTSKVEAEVIYFDVHVLLPTLEKSIKKHR